MQTLEKVSGWGAPSEAPRPRSRERVLPLFAVSTVCAAGPAASACSSVMAGTEPGEGHGDLEESGPPFPPAPGCPPPPLLVGTRPRRGLSFFEDVAVTDGAGGRPGERRVCPL